MDRRKAMKVFAGVAAGAGAGAYTLSRVFSTEYNPADIPKKLEYTHSASGWAYAVLDPALTGELAYDYYQQGSCMYAIFKSVLAQLADKFGEPYASFPFHMMGYGRSGIGGYGTICGALNGAAALIGLLVEGNSNQNTLITGLFRWYENKPIPEFKPRKAVLDFTPASSDSGSALCHASVTRWIKKTGYKADSPERVERCRRLTGDVAIRTAIILNDYTANHYVTDGHDNRNVRECMTCHGDKGKVNNSFGRMECASCHTESIRHRVFASPHYKLMKDK
jgi:hypothetical protein